MATDTNILREFLVSLGFKVTDADKFKQTIENTTKLIGQLGTALEALGTVGLLGLNKVTDRLVDLRYASQQLNGTPIQSIVAFAYALDRSGVKADEARASLKAFGDAIRTNPGLMQATYGVQTVDPKTGKIRDMTQILLDLGKKFRTMTDPQAFAVGGQFGLSHDMVFALKYNAPERYYNQDINQMNKNHKTVRWWEEQANKAKKWQDTWHNFVQKIQQETYDLYMKIQPIFMGIIHFLDKLSQATGGASTGFLALTAAMLPIIAFGNPLVAAIMAVVGALAILFADFKNWEDSGQSILPWSDWTNQFKEIGEDLRHLQDDFKGFKDFMDGDFAKSISGFVKNTLEALHFQLDAIHHLIRGIRFALGGDMANSDKEIGAFARSQIAAFQGNTNGTTVSAGHPLSESFDPVAIGQRARQGLENLTSRFDQANRQGGLYGPTGQGGGGSGGTGGGTVASQIGSFLASKGLAPDQIKGIMAGIFAEGGMNPDVVSGKKRGPKYGAYGIGQWLGSRRDALFAKYGNHPTLAQQLEFLWWELQGGDKTSNGSVLKNMGNAESVLGSYINSFMRPGPGSAGDMSRGRNWLSQNANVSFVNIKNEYHINGSGDPNATADAITKHQQRVYGNSTRWNKPAAS